MKRSPSASPQLRLFFFFVALFFSVSRVNARYNVTIERRLIVASTVILRKPLYTVGCFQPYQLELTLSGLYCAFTSLIRPLTADVN